MTKQPSTGLMWVIGIALILLGVVYFSIVPQTGKTLTIGVVAPMSGEFETYGTQMQEAYDLALSQINASGGILGKTVELIYKDGACDEEKATAAMNDLLATGEVTAVLGGGCLSETNTIRSLSEPAGALYIAATTLEKTDETSGMTFSTYPSVMQEVQGIAEHGFESGHTRAAILYQESDTADLLRNEFEGIYEGEVVYTGAFETQEDLDSMISNIRSSNPRMVLMIPRDATSGAMVLETLQKNWFNVGVYSTDGVVDAALFAENSSTYEELIIADVRVGEGEATQSFLDAYETMYGASPELPEVAASAFDGLNLLAEALTSSTGDSTAAAEYLSSHINAYSGAIGTFGFEKDGNTDLGPVLVQVTGGEMVEIQEAE